MKKVLHYAIRVDHHGPAIVAVTTERGSHWWGRTVSDDLGTHGTIGSLRGRFPTQEAAEAVRGEVEKVHSHFRAQVGVLDDLRQQLHNYEQGMVRDVLRGELLRGGEMPLVSAHIRRAKDPV